MGGHHKQSTAKSRYTNDYMHTQAPHTESLEEPEEGQYYFFSLYKTMWYVYVCGTYMCACMCMSVLTGVYPWIPSSSDVFCNAFHLF